MSMLIDGVLSYDNVDKYVIEKESNKVVLFRDNIRLEVYDQGNLVGFNFSGDLEGKTFYVLHDSDNYDRRNSKYKEIFDEARIDALHIVRVFLEGKIHAKLVEKKGLFKAKRVVCVIIPDAKGNEHVYDNLAANIVNFYEGH